MDIVNLITGLGIGAVLVAIIGWLKDRRKIASDTNLTDVQTLQNKLIYLEKVIDNIDKHNDRLQKDLEEVEARERERVKRIRELEDEVHSLRMNSRALEEQCARLSSKLTEFLGTEGSNKPK
jgi:predicted RNase H-like nuclease (RuvC/YqgF family)